MHSVCNKEAGIFFSNVTTGKETLNVIELITGNVLQTPEDDILHGFGSCLDYI